MLPAMLPWPAAVALAYTYAILAGGYTMPRLMNRIGSRHSAGEQWYRAGLGFVEQIVTVSAVLIGRIELIAAWVVFKVALRWGGWGSEAGLFSRYAIGTVASLSFGAAGGTIAYQLHQQDGLLPSLAIALAPLAIAGWIALLYDGRPPESKNRWQRFWDPDVRSEGIGSSSRLEGLAARLPEGANLDDLRIERRDREVLVELIHTLRDRPLGTLALFAGPSGTGKTMAAAIATELGLDLYRVDLSNVISQHIGETERNIKRLFDAAEDGGVILFFDEADAFFGKRSEVRDSHDRYGNTETSYLLERAENRRGLVIFSVKRRSSVDAAFLRRMRFHVDLASGG